MDTSERIFNVLFLCRANSARSIMAEAILNSEGLGKFKAYSAGSHPVEHVNPHALQLLKTLDHPTDALHSKGWDAFAGPDAPEFDFVFTVCDITKEQACPVWPGQPMMAHWGLPDPAAASGTEAEIAATFADTYRMLTSRISVFVNLPIRSLDKLTLQQRLDDIGTTTGAPEPA